MKTSNLILKAMENLQTNVALLQSVRTHLLTEIKDKEYDSISDKMADKELIRPSLALADFMHQLEEQYDYLEQLQLTIEKPF